MRFIWIDILRAIAVLVVMFHHIIWPQIKPLTTPYIFGNGGYMAVSLFFVLSGFVIALPYWQEKRNIKTTKEVLWFYKNRFFRLYPLFLISGILSIFVLFGVSTNTIKELFLSLSTIGSFLPNHFFPSINPVYWSLMLEILMSLLFPIILIFSRKIHIFWIFVFFAIISYFVQFFGWQIPFENPHTSPYRDTIFGHLDEFIFGIFIAFLSVKKNFSLSKKWIFPSIFVIFLWIFIADSWRYGQFFTIDFRPEIWLVSARNIFLMTAWFFLVFATFSIEKIPKFLSLIGAMCYSLYIWHVFVAMIFEKYFGEIAGIPITILYFFVTFFVSWISYELIEKRLWKWLVKRL